MKTEELRGQLEGNCLSEANVLWNSFCLIPCRLVGQDHVIDGDPKVETAFGIEVQHFFDAVRRNIFANVGEGPAVSHNRQPRRRNGRDPEKLAHSDSQQAMPLRQGVAATGTANAIHNPFRDQEAVGDPGREQFVRIDVITMAKPMRRARLCTEVETGIDQVLTIWEEEPHAVCLVVSRYARRRWLESIRTCDGTF